jgi:lipoprotein-anchoring transpeptidase ErfK/SrfK
VERSIRVEEDSMLWRGAHQGDSNERRQRGLREFALASLIVCVALLGVGSLIATASAVHFGFALAATHSQTTTTGGTVQDTQTTLQQSQDSHDIIPTCDCQTTQVTQTASLALTGVGKEILVSETKQQLYAYQDGQLQFTWPVVTGRPGLTTPIGRWHVMLKKADFTFYSPWPQGSPLWYYPTHIHYALLFHDGGFYLHDAWWRCTFGPGSNVPHHVSCMDEGDPPNRGPAPFSGTETGSHGCVGMTIAQTAQLYDWAPVGTTVLVVP